MLENIFVVVFLIGLVSVVIQRMKGVPPGRRPGGMPPFGQGPRLDDLPRRKPAQRTYTEPGGAEVRETRKPAYLEAELQDEPLLEPLSQPPAATTAAAAAASPSRTKAKQNVPDAAGGVSGHPAVQGMMWAEVFGPPRAKRPYRGKR